MFEQEIWKDIPNYEGKYQISNMGRVRNIQTNHIRKNNCSYGLYEKICLERNGKQELLSIHRLVGKAFIPNPQNKKEINHIDGNKRNNRADNLEWATRKENAQHSIKIGLQTKEQLDKAVKSMKVKNSKPILQIKNGKVIARYESAREASRQTKCWISAITCCAKQKKRFKTCKGFEWRYENE